MSRRYTLISSAHYIPLSPNEVIVKGSALEGFTLIIEDPEKRGITSSIIEKLNTTPLTPTELSEILDSTATSESCAEFLESMRKGGAISCIDSDPAYADLESAWSAFVRFGELPDSTLLKPVTVIGSQQTEEILKLAKSWGVPIKLISPEQVDLRKFITDSTSTDIATAEFQHRRNATPLLYVSFGAERAEMYRINEKAVSLGVAVLYARLDGVEYTVGPYVVPGHSACAWETERLWARSSADSEQYETLLRYRHNKESISNSIIGRTAFSTSLAISILELSLRGASERIANVLHGRATTQTISTHSVMRLPRCPVCLPLQPLVRNPLY